MQKKILVTLDGSALSEQALPHAVRYAKLESAQLVLMRVVEPVAKSYRAGSAPLGVIESVERQLKEIAQDYLNAQSARLHEQGLQVSTYLKTGNASQEILQMVEDEQVDLIVMATRGVTGVSRWLLGSVTDHVVRASSVPVLVIPCCAKDT